MFQRATKYNTQMTNILFIFFNLEIRNKQIIEEKDISIHNLQGVLEKEQKLKTKLQVKKHENNEVLTKLELANIILTSWKSTTRIYRKSKWKKILCRQLLTQINANYQKLKIEKDSLNVGHNKLHKDCKNMEQMILKQKEVKELIMDIGNLYQSKMSYKGNLSKGRQGWIKICRSRWHLMKGCKKFWRRFKESSPSIMIMYSKKIMNSRRNIVCFK